MILFIQTFRFAAEPFYFAQERTLNSKKIYADVMKYFVVVISIIFLLVTTFYDFFINFLGSNYHDERGFLVVSILLLANFFLGIYYNLSIWFKLTEKTIYGAYIAIFGAIVTLIGNYTLIPIIGFVGCAISTLVCYFLMTILSLYLCNKHYPIPYNYKRMLLYFLLMISIYFILNYSNFTFVINFLKPLPNRAHKLIVGKHIIAAVIVTNATPIKMFSSVGKKPEATVKAIDQALGFIN